MAFLASIGGPVTIAFGIVALGTLVGMALFGASWETKLARRIHAEFEKRGIQERSVSALEGYWVQTREAFEKGADAVEEKFQAYVADLSSVVSDQENGRQQLEKRPRCIEDARDFFGGIPWQALE